MDNSGKPTTSQNTAALVIVAFLEADCKDQEIRSICRDITSNWDINCNERQIATCQEDYEELESDGHLSESIRASLDDIQPHVDLPWLAGGRAEEAIDYRAIAQGLREIADQFEAQFEHNLVAQAAQNLRVKISSSPSNQWKDYLKYEVDQLLWRGVALEHLSQERVIVALTLTLLKRVCVQAPELIRSLFTTVHQLVCRAA